MFPLSDVLAYTLGKHLHFMCKYNEYHNDILCNVHVMEMKKPISLFD